MPRPLQVENIGSLPFDLESGVWVTCDVGYLCAFFSLHRPLCSRLRPDVRDRQTDVGRASSLNAPYPRGGGIMIESWMAEDCRIFRFYWVTAYVCVCVCLHLCICVCVFPSRRQENISCSRTRPAPSRNSQSPTSYRDTSTTLTWSAVANSICASTSWLRPYVSLWAVYISVRLIGHFPGEPGSAGVYWSKG